MGPPILRHSHVYYVDVIYLKMHGCIIWHLVQRSPHGPLITCCLRFRSVTHIFGEVGHTHGPVDQRLSILTAAFVAADVIQSPEDGNWHDGVCYLLLYIIAIIPKSHSQETMETIQGIKYTVVPIQINPILISFILATLKDFVAIIKEKVKPARNRELRAEILFGSLNWRDFYAQYATDMGGLVTKPNSDLSVNHCWRFIRRADTIICPWWLFSFFCGDFLGVRYPEN